jgi:hypothetical protein
MHVHSPGFKAVVDAVRVPTYIVGLLISAMLHTGSIPARA